MRVQTSLFPMLSALCILIASCHQGAIAFTPSGMHLPFRSADTLKTDRTRLVLSSSSLKMSSAVNAPSEDPSQAAGPSPTTFREAEVLGLRLMQDGRHEEALKAFQQAMKLPGSRPDIIRTKTLSGPSPVGGSQGGTEGRNVMNLDEFELQAAHYNIACACSRLGNVAESVANLKQAFDFGFDNYATVRADPDLDVVQGTAEFESLMNDYDPKKGFFSLFGGGKK